MPIGEQRGVEDEDYTVEGSDLQFRDEGGGPLWGIEGLLPDDPPASWRCVRGPP